MRFNNIYKILFVFCATLSMSDIATAVVINKIDVVGNHRVDASTITSTITVKPGDEVNSDDLDKVLRELFDTGYFADVKPELVGSTLKIQVVENPMVNQIMFEGNSEIEDKLFKEHIKLKKRQVFSITKLKDDTKTIYDMYRIKGYFAAKVEPKTIKRDQNRVDVIFEITEGESTQIQKIAFIGNKHFSNDKLERTIQTKESRWYRFFNSDANYDSDKILYDQELLRRFYYEHGYADFRVKSAVAELTPDQKEFFITFTIDEGERYRVGKVNVVSNIAKLNADDLAKMLTMKEGGWYSSKDVENTIKILTDKLGSSGYAFTDIKPNTNKNSIAKTVDISFEIDEGPRVYIDRIIIKGNYRTDEEVIRRELLLYEGDAYNSFMIKESERRLKYLGFFKKVTVNKEPSTSPDKVNLIIDLEEEESTGEFMIGGGYSTSEGILGEVGIRQRNLLGRGQDLALKFKASSKSRGVDLGFTEPYFLDRPLAAGFDVYHSDSKLFFDSNFKHKTTGLNLRLGYNLADYLYQSWTYIIKSDTLSNIRHNASKFLIQQKGTKITSAIRHGIVYDRRDSPIDPTEGYFVGFSNEFAGVGGDIKYLKNDVFGAYYIPVMEEVVLGLSARAGTMEGLGKVRIVDRYNVGGDNSIRGFRLSGCEVRDRVFRDPLGAKNYYISTAELVFPLGLPKEIGIKGSVFTDMGAGWGADEPRHQIFESSKPRVSVGVGLTWASPLGPIRVDFARAVKHEKFDRKRTFHFGFGTRF